uniref:Cytosolic carboxypeptidase N-terminal domain-containing protein n=1 Tax=Chelonoidis abingdonii TaxID=106734 RepID=A0A8C0G7J0_CHEAB
GVSISGTKPEDDLGSDDIIAGNVSKYTVLPAGYYGQPKKGHLIFDAFFESGNLGRVDHITEFEYDLFIRPDTCNPRFRVWFNFTVENVKESQVTRLWGRDRTPSSPAWLFLEQGGKSGPCLGTSLASGTLSLLQCGRRASYVQGKYPELGLISPQEQLCRGRGSPVPP